MPRGVYTRTPRPPKTYPAAMVAEVEELYASGLTQAEVAMRIGTTQKVVHRLMTVHGIQARVAAKRDQSGPANHMWKGSDASYKAKHQRITVAFGQPSECSVCGTTDPEVSYDWASFTGNYDDPNDYVRMCRSCHWKHDGTVANLRGGDATCQTS